DFDESYYATRDVKAAELLKRAVAREEALDTGKIDEAALKDLDMELKEATPAEDFHSDETPNIWALPDEENVAPEDREAELDKPSFLRRLTKRSGKQPDLEEFGKVDDDQPVDTGTKSNDDSTATDEADNNNPLHGEKPEPSDEPEATETKEESEPKKGRKSKD
ncbi:hypothetical protein KW801_02985, partial [Candidatus Saccharibacteria bacterium]|nr:hypothetical protein [Candidatus Saccharibacteria bacterium]